MDIGGCIDYLFLIHHREHTEHGEKKVFTEKPLSALCDLCGSSLFFYFGILSILQ